jgi:hypothetical protein
MILGIELAELAVTLVLYEDDVDEGCLKNDPGGNVPGVRKGAEAVMVVVLVLMFVLLVDSCIAVLGRAGGGISEVY